MPGLDHDVHPDTVGGERYDACRNKARAPGYWVQTLSYKRNPPMRVWHWIEDTLSKDCRYDRSLIDDKCEGCSRRGQGEAYSGDIRKRGT
jgi:hypothetical protein